MSTGAESLAEPGRACSEPDTTIEPDLFTRACAEGQKGKARRHSRRSASDGVNENISVKKKYIWWACGLLLLIAILVVRIPVYQKVTCIDANSGELRIQKFFLKIPVGTEIQKTKFSILANQLNLTMFPPIWKHAYSRTFYTGSYGFLYSSYKYNSCPIECKNLLTFFELNNISTNKKKEIVQSFIEYMQQSQPEMLKKEILKLQKTAHNPLSP